MKTTRSQSRVCSAALLVVLAATAACGARPDERTGDSTSGISAGQGVDYSWARPSPDALRAAGYTFAARYLSPGTGGKNLSAGEAAALIAAGVDVVANWESSGTDALSGYGAGVADAQAADAEARADGMPAGRPIYFSLDFDAGPADQAVIDAYFDGVASVLGEARTGAYGGYWAIHQLFDAGKIQFGWQTYAWSGGQWDPRAQMRQIQNGVTVAGASCDVDEAVAADFGQWGHASPGNPEATYYYQGMARDETGDGYWILGRDGGIFSYGDAGFHGSMGDKPLNAPIVAIAATPDSQGYWLVSSDGGVFSLGDAPFYGSAGATKLNQPVVGMASMPDGKGYWLVAADGGIFSYGSAGFHGSMGGKPLHAPVVGMAATHDGEGYWLVAADGGIFAFGDAAFLGSAGAQKLNAPVVGMAATPSGGGYWLVAADGGIFAYGDAPFHGSMGGKKLNAPIVGMSATPNAGGYWLVAGDGGIFAFGNAPFAGSRG